MVGIELLRALAAHLDPGDEVAGLESRTLRFVIEYATEVNVATKVEEIRSAIGIDDFQFFPLLDGPSTDPEFGEFYVLQFPGLERTVDNRSLFSIAHELQSLLGAVTVEPDLGSDFYQEPVAPDAAPEGVLKDLFLGTCFVAGDPPADRHWALDRAGVLRAFDARPARGAGIRIAQPDTGVTQHTELADTTITDGFNVLTGASDPTDPLSGGGNPGHGTGTASVLASGPNGQVLGSAPAATLVPIRCIESVILTFNGGAVAKAIDHAPAWLRRRDDEPRRNPEPRHAEGHQAGDPVGHDRARRGGELRRPRRLSGAVRRGHRRRRQQCQRRHLARFVPRPGGRHHRAGREGGRRSPGRRATPTSAVARARRSRLPSPQAWPRCGSRTTGGRPCWQRLASVRCRSRRSFARR